MVGEVFFHSIPTEAEASQNLLQTRVWFYGAVALGHLLLILLIAIFSKPVGPVLMSQDRSITMNLSEFDFPQTEEQPKPPETQTVQTQTFQQPSTDATAATSTDLPAFAPSSPPKTNGGGEPDWDSFIPQFQLILPDISDAELKKRVRYPEMAEKAGIAGEVVLDLFVDTTGRVRRVVILKETPTDKGFGESAKVAFSTLVFSQPPRTKDGKPALGHFRKRVIFNSK